MKIIENNCTDPAFNLALEEYVLTELRGEYLLFWRNSESVILGKNQNALSELDENFVKEHDIQVVRRNSGGGAVFHDLGNINFTFVEDYTKDAFNNYEKFTRPIADYLRTRGIDATLSGRNDLLIGDVKVSGNAQAVRRGRLLHHGTLLYSADMSKLVGALKPKPIKHTGRSVKSVSSRVANIKSLFPDLPPVELFLSELTSFFKADEGVSVYVLSDAELFEIEALAESKYRSWAWNFGETPKFSMEKSRKYDFGVVETCFTVRHGTFEQLRLFGDFFGVSDIAELERKINGTTFEKEQLLLLLGKLPLGDYIFGMSEKALADLIFS